MSDRTFRLILDGKKGGLVKGSSPSSAAKKACKKLSAELGKTSIKFELQETTKDSKKKVYGPYKGCLEKDKIKVKMAGGGKKGPQVTAILNSYGEKHVYEEPYNTTPEGKIRYNLLKNIPNQHKIKMEFDELYNMPPINIKKLKNLTLFEKQKEKLQKLLKKYQKSNATNENKNELQNKYSKYGKLNQPNKELFNRFLENATGVNMYGKNNIKKLYEKDRKNAEIKNLEDKERDRKRAIKIIDYYLNRYYNRMSEEIKKHNPELYEKLVTDVINSNFNIKNRNELVKLIEETSQNGLLNIKKLALPIFHQKRQNTN
jgi:vacuolar-type H+-ATPase subunit I/STV1